MGECIVCRHPFDFTLCLPMRMKCSNALCKSCVRKLEKSGQIKCPHDNVVEPINDIEIFPVHEEILKSLIGCSFHRDALAQKYCEDHVLLLCSVCISRHECCRLVEPLPVTIRAHVYKLLENSRNQLTALPESLRSDVEYVAIENTLISVIIRTYHKVKFAQNPTVCKKCSSRSCEYFKLKSLTLRCSSCFQGLPQSKTEQFRNFSSEEDLREQIRSQVMQHLRQVPAFCLSKPQAKWLRQQKQPLPEFLLSARLLFEKYPQFTNEGDGFPLLVQCPQCLRNARCETLKLRILPCEGVLHYLCDECAARGVICPLDGNYFPILRCWLQTFEFRASENGETTAVLVDGRRRIGEGDPLFNCGLLLLPFSYPSQALIAVERFTHVFPVPDLPQTEPKCLLPWYVNLFQGQIEALSFSCSSDVHLCGFGLAMPVEVNTVLLLREIRMYQGAAATGSYHLLNREVYQLIGGSKIVTDIYVEEFPLVAGCIYTLAIRLDSDPPGQQVAIYHGSHIGRYGDLAGEDNVEWRCVKTAGVETGELNSGQHEYSSPILRLIYRRVSS